MTIKSETKAVMAKNFVINEETGEVSYFGKKQNVEEVKAVNVEDDDDDTPSSDSTLKFDVEAINKINKMLKAKN